MSDKKINPLWLVVLALVAWWSLTGGKLPTLPSFPNVLPGPSVPAVAEPSAEMKAAVAPVTAALRGSDKASEVSAFYSQFADLLERDSTVATTTAQVRSWHVAASNLMFQKAGVPSGVSAAVNASLEKILGVENKAIDRPKAVSAFRAIAWACKEAG